MYEQQRELARFWQHRNHLKESDRIQHSGVVENRIWKIIGRVEPRYLFGQRISSFQAEDITAKTKILLMNLSGVPKGLESLHGWWGIDFVS